MKINNVLMIAILAVLVIGVSGCGNNGETTVAGNAWVGGTTGVLISFIEGAPPTTVHTGGDEPFGVSIKLENLGEETIAKEDITISLSGFDPEDFGTTLSGMSQNSPEELIKTGLDPDTGNILQTSPVFVDFDLNYVADLGGASHDFPMVAEVCYAYKTYASADLCIKENLLDTTNDDVCKVIGTKTISNSGAPVQVQSFEEFTSGKDAVRFTFVIKKMATGDVFTRDSTCNDERVDENKVHVIIDTGISNLECSTLGGTNEGTIKLVEGEKQIMCTQRLSETDKSNKVKLVNFELSYDFQDTAQTSIKVVSQLEY